MRSERTSPERVLLLLLTLAHPVVALAYRPRLPARVASHYGPTGAPDAWSSRDALLIGLVSVAFAMLGLFSLTRWLVGTTRDEWVNLPHKAYWLAPERREETLRRIVRHLLRIGVATQALLLVVFLEVLRANAAAPATGRNALGPAAPIALGIYLLALLALLVALFRDFARPKPEGEVS